MFDDKDIKIAGSKPSLSIRQSRETEEVTAELNRAKAGGEFEKARELGEKMAVKLLDNKGDAAFGTVDEADGDDLLQRRNLLAFTVTVGFEKNCRSSMISAAAYGAFYDCVKRLDSKIYDELSDTGVFSFYYLAYRRGGEVERRMGQTFAMLCGRDGDPVYQELGEALYCYFSAVVESAVKELGL